MQNTETVAEERTLTERFFGVVASTCIGFSRTLDDVKDMMIGDSIQEQQAYMNYHLSTTLADYEHDARKTAIYKGANTFDGVIYNSLKLAGEAGEIADKSGKIFGKGSTPTPEQVLDLEKELGDVLWHLTNLGVDLGLTLEGIARKNTEKLLDRQERGVLMGKPGDGAILKGDDR